MNKLQKNGFTLIELMIVIAMITVIAAIVFVALDPFTRFTDARDAHRFADVNTIMSTLTMDSVGDKESYLSVMSSLTADTVYMIGTATTGCDDAFIAGNCEATILADTDCIDLTGLVTEGYLASVPVSPNGLGTWSDDITGYTVTRASTGIITIQACESENSTTISVSN